MKIVQHNNQFHALTGIRAVAAFLVFFHHLPFLPVCGFLNSLQRTFYWGVDLFFVLSGFLITYRYYNKASLSGKWLFPYFVRRFARIYPVYFLVLTIVIILLHNTDTVFLLQNYTLTHHLFFLFPTHGMAIAPSWSLTVEECFYLLAPVIFLLGRRYQFWLPFVLTIVLLMAILFFYCKNYKDVFLVFSGTFFGCFLKFYAGIFLALVILKKEQSKGLHIGGLKYTTLGFGGMLFFLIPLIYATHQPEPTQFPIIIVANNFLMPFPVAAFYYGLICEESMLKRMLSGKAMQLFGRSSYAFYLIHVPLITYITDPYIRPFFSNFYDIYVLVAFASALLLSVAIYIIYENPVNNFIRKKLI